MKTILLLFACMMMLSRSAMCQTTRDQEEIEKPEDFEEVRSKDFTKLIGGFQDGFRLNYNPEKSNVEFSKAWKAKDNWYVQATGAAGTTTNLTGIFDQELLPTYSGTLTLHYLMEPGSTYFYDATLERNLSQITNPAVRISSISTDLYRRTDTLIGPFKYREPLREKVRGGKITGASGSRLYTFKRLNWWSFTAKHDYAKYAFFDPSAAFGNQFTNPQHRTWSAKLTYNLFLSWNKTDAYWTKSRWWTAGLNWRPEFIYLTVGITRGKGNNVSGLKKQSIQTITSQIIDTTTGTVRQVVDTKTAYQGTYIEYTTITPYVELIIAPLRQVALFGNLESALIDTAVKEHYSLSNTNAWAAGIYFYGDGNKSNINIGVFYKRVQDSRTNDWVGTFNIRTSIPITPL